MKDIENHIWTARGGKGRRGNEQKERVKPPLVHLCLRPCPLGLNEVSVRYSYITSGEKLILFHENKLTHLHQSRISKFCFTTIRSKGPTRMRGQRPRNEAQSAEGGEVWGGGMPPLQWGSGGLTLEIFF